MVNLSSAHILTGQHLMSQEHLAIANDIAHRYRNLRLVFIPVSDRIPGEDDKPFGIVNKDTNTLIKAVPEYQVKMLPAWLYENDSQRIDTYAAFKAEEAKAAADRKAAHVERTGPMIEFASAALRSNLHTYRHGNRKYSDGGIETIN